MKKKYRIYSDLHIFGKHAINIAPYGAPEDFTDVYLGDNIEINNCLKKDLKDAKETLEEIYEYYKNKKLPFVTGNHELNALNKDNSPVIETRDNVLFIHGDLEPLWDFKKGDSYRKKNKPGCGFFKYHFVTPLIDKLRFFKKYKLKEKHLESAHKLCLYYNCHTIVCGHVHPENLIIKKYKEITIVIVPRGMTDLEL